MTLISRSDRHRHAIRRESSLLVRIVHVEQTILPCESGNHQRWPGIFVLKLF